MTSRARYVTLGFMRFRALISDRRISPEPEGSGPEVPRPPFDLSAVHSQTAMFRKRAIRSTTAPEVPGRTTCPLDAKPGYFAQPAA
jgi:hypothetical protein